MIELAGQVALNKRGNSKRYKRRGKIWWGWKLTGNTRVARTATAW
jgi:hypothetical protein